MTHLKTLLLPLAVAALLLAGCSDTRTAPGETGGQVHGASCPTAVTCADAGASCGSIDDGCGGVLTCGACGVGQNCINSQCIDANCQPKSCASAGAQCGPVDDGCGGMLDCGFCPEGLFCWEDNTCGDPTCEPKTCETAGIQCGAASDGCGGALFCGTCGEGETCVEGLCDGGTECEPVGCQAQGIECGPAADGCGGTQDCGGCLVGQTCEGGLCTGQACIPATCESLGAQCGPAVDGCGGDLDCGGCEPGWGCDGNTCVQGLCEPRCDGKECGDDGCGGSCGDCGGDAYCDDAAQCQTAYCAGECGSNQDQISGQGDCYCDAACWGYGDCCPDICISCGEDYPDNCCTPACEGKACGDDGCGGSCGSCGEGSSCLPDGTCSECVPACDGLECGGDGCGGSCGSCDPGDSCEGGICVACEPACDGKACGPDGCGGECGVCPEGDLCDGAGQCVACVPDCEGKICGDDGCGGVCGGCTFDCDSVPAGPVSLVELDGPIASEDLAFDAEGHVIGSNDNAIFKSEYGGTPQVWVPSLDFRAGLRFLPTGDLVVNNDKTGQFLRITPDATIHVVLNGLSYPNGLAVDMDGMVIVTEHDAKRVLQVDPYSGEFDIVTEGVITNPNGAAYNPTYTVLYLAGFSGVGTIYRYAVNADGTIGEQLTHLATDVGTGWLDGIGVDICGNVYIADYYQTKILRFWEGESSYHTFAQGGSGDYLPNLQWGSGIGGWDSMKIYSPDGWQKGVFEMDAQVPSPPVPYPPAAE